MQRLLLLLIGLLSIGSMQATGPSWVTSQLCPVSINSQGDILCKMRLQKNDTGGYYYTPIQYGLCVLSKGQLLEYPTDSIDPSIIDTYNKDLSDEIITDDLYMQIEHRMDSLFNTPLDFNNLGEIEKQVCEQYGFEANNVDKYKTNKKWDIVSLAKDKKVNIDMLSQKAIGGATENKSIERNNKFLCVEYDFGDVLIINNVSALEDEDISCGPEFNYTTFYTINDRTELIGYDMSRITGVLFLK